MKKLSATLLLCLAHVALFACPVCERNQPEILKGVTHGTGPDGTIDYIIVAVSIVITLLTLFYSIKWLIRPGEKNQDHIKFTILNTEQS